MKWTEAFLIIALSLFIIGMSSAMAGSEDPNFTIGCAAFLVSAFVTMFGGLVYLKLCEMHDIMLKDEP